MQSPRFWYRSTSPLAWALSPAEMIYRIGTMIHQTITPMSYFPAPIICVGNIVAGGAGKTPLVHTIAHTLKEMGKRVAILSRGYGGEIKLPTLVTSGHTPAMVGEEPKLLSADFPVWIGADRKATAWHALKTAPGTYDVFIMDDGLQNPTLPKDLSFLVIDGQQGIGNGHVVPAGPLRQGLRAGLKNVQAVVLVGQDKHNLSSRIKGHKYPLLEAIIEPDRATLSALADQKVYAFAGLGYPEKFFTTLREHNISVEVKRPFPDHHFYKEAELGAMLKAARDQGLRLITTEKDYIKIPAAYQKFITVLPIRLVLKRPQQLITLLKKHICPII